MHYIAHRGLFKGPNAEAENTPWQIITAGEAGFSCEIDIWWDGETWLLGHDRPTIAIGDFAWLNRSDAWLHCKNLAAFHRLCDINQAGELVADFFWHETDRVVRTAQGRIWTYLGLPDSLGPYSICVMPELNYSFNQVAKIKNCAGFCSDHVEAIRILHQQ